MNSKEVKEILAKVLEIDIATIFDNATQKDIAGEMLKAIEKHYKWK